MSNTKSPYHTPVVKDLGSVSQLTQGGSEGDCFDGDGYAASVAS
jgi:hypothetical protein